MSSPPSPPGPARSAMAAVAVWGARLAWLAVGLLGARAVGAALRDHDEGAAAILTVGAWTAWAVGALALGVPSAPTLTAARVVVPGALAVAVATAIGGATAVDVLALGGSGLLATVLTCSAEVGRGWVQASAYGDEERLPLRPPVGYLVAAVVAWLLWVTAALIAVVSLSDGRWVPGLAAATVAAGGLALLPRRWHRLSQRWLVTVPAGLVVHDPVVLGETLMLTRRQVAALSLTRLPVRGDDAPADLTGPAAGTGVAVALAETVTVLFSPQPAHHPQDRVLHLRSFVVAPSRPGAALAEARRRRLPVR